MYLVSKAPELFRLWKLSLRGIEAERMQIYFGVVIVIYTNPKAEVGSNSVPIKGPWSIRFPKPTKGPNLSTMKS